MQQAKENRGFPGLSYPSEWCSVSYTWWRFDMEMLSTLLALCGGNPPVTNGFHSHETSNVELWYFVVFGGFFLLTLSCWTDNWVARDFRYHDTHITSLQLNILQQHRLPNHSLTHWGRDKMAAIFQTTYSNGFSWMKMYGFRLTFHWSLFLGVQLTIFQHWFR